MRRALVVLLTATIAATAALTASPARADDATDPGPLVLVFDVSGSMNDESADGVVKLSTAKKSMSDMIYTMDGSTQALGLWTYPGGKDDGQGCEVGEWVSGLSPNKKPDTTNVQAQIGLLSADGGTPTGPALRAVVDSLRAQKFTNATIVLVSDGEANCGPPACDVAKEVMNQDFALTVAAVAFDIADDSGLADLECTARETGGSYSTADDTTQLMEQLEEYQYKDLELTVDAPSIVRAGEVMRVTATVRNDSRNPVSEGTLKLGFGNDADITRQIPAPQYRLPTIAPNSEITRTWVVPTRSSVKGKKTWSVAAGTRKSGSVVKTGDVTFTDRHLTRLDGSELLDGYDGTVLVLGDSYSSGEGTADYVENDYESADGTVRCHRSKSAYGGVVAGDAATIIACSGALSWEMGSKNVGTADQLSLLSLATKPDVVFLTIGGNDIGFAGIVEQCFLGDCSANETGHLSRIAAHSGWTETYERISQVVNQPKRLQHRDGRPVPVIVSPYPDPLWETTRGRCNAGAEIGDWIRNGFSLGIIRQFKGKEASEIGFSSRDIATGKRILAALNTKVQESVEKAREHGYPIYYAGTTSGFALGHSICEDDSYFVRLDPKSSVWRTMKGNGAVQELFHPNKQGHRAWADALITWSQTQSVDPTLEGQPLGPVQKPFVPLIWRPKADLGPKLQPVQPNLLYPAAPETPWLAPTSDVNLKVNGLAPGSRVLVTLRSEPIALGQISVGEDGVASGTLTLPSELSNGSHELIIEGYNEDFELVGAVVNLQVWSGVPWVLAAAMLVCVLSGVAAVIARRISRARRNAAVVGN